MRRIGLIAVLVLLVGGAALANVPAAATSRAAAGGVDGVINGSFGFHTEREASPWWQVDLGASQPLDRLVVYNRCNTASDRARTLIVQLSTDGKAWQPVYRHDGGVFGGHADGKPLTIALGGAAGRFVRLTIAEANWLHLDEVQVYGKADPHKNIALNRPADQSSIYGRSAPGTVHAPPAPPRVSAEQVAAAIEAGSRLAADLRTMRVDTAGDEQRLAELRQRLATAPPAELAPQVEAAVRALALKNPLLDFDKLLVVRRKGEIGLPQNWQSNCSLKRNGYDDELLALSLRTGEAATIYKPAAGRFVGDVDLHFDGRRVLFSSTDDAGRWQVFELNTDGSGLRQVTPGDDADIDNFDACYLPDGRIIYCSTMGYQGVPCVYGSDHVGNLVLLDPAADAAAGKPHVRRLTFDQDHSWCPTPMNDGSVMYLRWEYSDLPHSNSRILFQMNPDGTNQRELYGSNSYFPNSFFFARPIPGSARIVGVASGHHGTRRSGRLLILDPLLGRSEASGVVQEIPGYGKAVEPIVRDRLVDGVWPQFLHPYPLSDKYFLVAGKLTSGSPWAIYLVDIWDNLVLVKEEAGAALLEPVPLRATAPPPVLADRVDLDDPKATVYIADVYDGPGLAGVPRGTVKKLRVIEYHFSYRGIGGLLGGVGADGPWDIKRVLGTVDVSPEGAAAFRIPANTPVTVQPLDDKHEALQIMRSWFVGMPGEKVTCVGCHGSHQKTAAMSGTYAKVADLKPWYGPPRGFSFAREVQPVLDRHCAGCHDGREAPGGKPLAYLKGDRMAPPWVSRQSGNIGDRTEPYSMAYAALHGFVRRPGIESDMRMLPTADFAAGTTELVQMLRKGHHGVQLDDEAWDRLITWIDLNAPYHGTWTEMVKGGRVSQTAARAQELRRKYAPIGSEVEYESVAAPAPTHIEPIVPEVSDARPTVPQVAGWPFGADEARRRQQAAASGGAITKRVDLGEGVVVEFVLIPPGEYVMGDPDGAADERALRVVKIEKPLWMSTCEISNEQFGRFDASHDSRLESRHGYQFGRQGWPLNEPKQPVVRVSAKQAEAFARWIGERAGASGRLPSEAEWEWACRAGSDKAFWFGESGADFTAYANMGDRRLREYAADTSLSGYEAAGPVKDPTPYDDWVPKDERFDDGSFLSSAVGRYGANPWGLHDMHGNVWEWTHSAYQPVGSAVAASAADGGLRVVRGGSWYDRPHRCRSGSRLFYKSWQPVYNVGFRVVLEP